MSDTPKMRPQIQSIELIYTDGSKAYKGFASNDNVVIFAEIRHVEKVKWE
jgi:hypothetical protein